MGNVASEPASRRRGLLVGAAVAGIVALDQLTKVWAVAALSDGPQPVFGHGVELRLSRNPGGAFSSFQGLTPLLAGVAVVLVVVLVRNVRRATDPVLLVGLTLLLGGALGNLCDRVFRSPGPMRGHVVDFVAIGAFPLFNVADSCITVGAVLLVVHALRDRSR